MLKNSLQHIWLSNHILLHKPVTTLTNVLLILVWKIIQVCHNSIEFFDLYMKLPVLARFPKWGLPDVRCAWWRYSTVFDRTYLQFWCDDPLFVMHFYVLINIHNCRFKYNIEFKEPIRCHLGYSLYMVLVMWCYLLY